MQLASVFPAPLSSPPGRRNPTLSRHSGSRREWRRLGPTFYNSLFFFFLSLAPSTPAVPVGRVGDWDLFRRLRLVKFTGVEKALSGQPPPIPVFVEPAAVCQSLILPQTV
ncbi:hypothetical protein BaRGS_00003478 [Batillaria attramentaria]|uniref:Uncharacterized protein n=1 Tax=Batillaria attramentaria TaxID=370345 RepID=A0ABD0M0V3_9CAEN